jgi:peptidoglycan/xylan/chitin deacetylase (PgdA/CDA1 family)
VVNIEEWEITRPMARQLSIAPQGQSVIPDMPNWTWYEYGMRVGFWRLMRALEQAKVTPTMSLNAKVCETYPEVAAAARDARWEFMAHSYVQMPIQQIEDQRAVMRQSIDIIKAFTGKTPTGWLGPGRGQTHDTLDYATECGFTWFGDWVLDDQPFWVKTKNGPILSVPYSAEINDITLMVSHHHESDVLLKRTADAFDRLYAESAESARVLAIGAHPYVTGRASHPFLRALRVHHQLIEGALHGPASRSTTGTPRSRPLNELGRHSGAERSEAPESITTSGEYGFWLRGFARAPE